ncbi:hypothetical protein MRB53_021647 [Persea americana]|uniref:Uncharacterized protein n=1 Tax=Persea americana TaxID=3435 RepID=A0ACC2L4Z0_PERAE|nr:hypothetical protein MRB53_021647 [Persea americana]
MAFALRSGGGKGKGKVEKPDRHAKIDGGGVGRSRPPGRGRGNARANTVAANVGAAGSLVAVGPAGSAGHSGSSQLFSAEQWQAIVGLFGNTKIPDDRLNGKFDDKLWIIDTGATHHVTGDATWLFDTQEIFYCPVGLPNGETVNATQEGSDQTRELIGTVVRRDGLYYFGEANSVQHVSVNGAASTMELWHKRMGHPSEKVVKLLPPVRNSKDVFPFIDTDATNIVPANIVPIHDEVHSDFDDHVIEEIEPQQSATHTTPQLAQTDSPLLPPPNVPSVQAHPLDEQTAATHQADLLPLPLSPSPNTEAPMQQPTHTASPQHITSSVPLEPTKMGRGMRDKLSSVLLRDFVTHTVVAGSPSPSTSSP